MVLLHVISDDPQQAKEIATLLVKEDLVLSAVTLEEVKVKQKADGGELTDSSQTLIIGRTKGLLFNTIDLRLRELYALNMPVLYSVPIVNMDWEQADKLVQRTAKV